MKILKIESKPHNDRLSTLPHICLRFLRHLSPKLFELQQYSCVVFIQSDEKIDCESARQSLCGVALSFI